MKFPNLIQDYFNDLNEPNYIKYSSYEGKITRQSKIPIIHAPIQIPVDIILNEFVKINDFYPQRPSYGHKSWNAVTLFGYGQQKTKSYWEYDPRINKKHLTEAGSQMRETVDWIKHLPFSRIDDIRLLVLEPGGYIAPHKDHKDGPWLEPLSIALNWPVGCHFKFQEFGYIPFHKAPAFFINVGYEHAVINNSNERRIQLVIHGKKKDTFLSELS